MTSGVLTRLSVSFSRDSTDDAGPSDTTTTPIIVHRPAPRYVQDNMHLHGSELVEMVHTREARVYVCGDASNMARSIQATLVELLQMHTGG